MKNIHVLPTDKPSRLLYFGTSKELTLQVNPATFRVFERSTQNIYITSDEEIKEGDWFIFGVNESVLRMLEAACKANIKYNGAKKIMLTTDPQLIKFGVQAIDDEFLEWFVKNPSCEYVEVEEFEPIYGHQNNSSSVLYKTIIPKEEPNIIDQWLEKNGNPEITKQVDEEAKKLQKQHLIDMMKQDEELGLYEQTKCYCGHTITCDCGPEQEIKLEDVFNDEKKANIKKFIDEINNPSQPNQALKDAAENYGWKIKRNTFSDAVKANELADSAKQDFIEGAKWQQERSYSEVEVIELLQKALTHQDDGETGSLVTAQGKIRTANFFSWFNKFKKN